MDHHDSTQFGPSSQEGAGYDDAGEDRSVPAMTDAERQYAEDLARYYAAKARRQRLDALGLEEEPEAQEAPAQEAEAQDSGETADTPADKSAAEERAGYSSKFGRGWIPAEREIGLPGEELPAVYHSVAPAQAGAYPDLTYRSDGGVCRMGGDGPLPAQGRREDCGDVALRTPRHTDFTPPRRAQFLHVLAEQGNVLVACAKVGVSRQAAYLARRRDEWFRAGWEAALVHARAFSEQVLANVALEGVREKVFYRGDCVGEKVRIDARLLLAHLARLDAKAADPRAQAHAERFDELLAVVSGLALPEDMADPDDPLLPLARRRYVAARAAGLRFAVLDPFDAADPWSDEEDDNDDRPDPAAAAEDAALIAVHDAAAAEWDDWQDRVDAIAAALDAGEAPVVGEGGGGGRSNPASVAPGEARATVKDVAAGEPEACPKEDWEPSTPSILSISPAETGPEPGPEASHTAAPGNENGNENGAGIAAGPIGAFPLRKNAIAAAPLPDDRPR